MNSSDRPELWGVMATQPTSRPACTASPVVGGSVDGRRLYLGVLTWAFTLFNSVRVASYLPTIWAIQASADSSQHSLWTWITWVGANATMAAWLYEQNGRRLHRAAAVNIGNAVMCLATVLLIVAYRF